MPYEDKSGTPPAAAGLEAGSGDAAMGEGAADQAEPIHIQADMLPPGIAEGDMLKCTGMDENGCSFELVKGQAEPAKESWEEGFRKEFSPQQSTEEAS
jgi:hypothetical protein